MNVGHRGARLVEPTGKSQRQRRYRTDIRMCIRTGGGLHAPLRGCLEIAGPYQRHGPCSEHAEEQRVERTQKARVVGVR